MGPGASEFLFGKEEQQVQHSEDVWRAELHISGFSCVQKERGAEFSCRFWGFIQSGEHSGELFDACVPSSVHRRS